MGLPCPLSQLDGFKDASEDQVNPQCQIMTNGRTPTPNFHPKETPNGTPNSGSQMNEADIATSSAHHLPAFSTPTKRPIPRPCQPASPKLEGVAGTKSTLTSTSTSPLRQSSSEQYAGVKNAAQAAFLGASPQRLGKEVKARSSSLVSPNRG